MEIGFGEQDLDRFELKRKVHVFGYPKVGTVHKELPVLGVVSVGLSQLPTMNNLPL